MFTDVKVAPAAGRVSARCCAKVVVRRVGAVVVVVVSDVGLSSENSRRMATRVRSMTHCPN